MSETATTTTTVGSDAIVRLPSNRFRYENSGRAQMICQPLDFNGDGWNVDKGWRLVGWTPNPGWQAATPRAGIMFENEDGTEEAWFHWDECHLDLLPLPNSPSEPPPVGSGDSSNT